MRDQEEFHAYLLRRLDLAGKAEVSTLEPLSEGHSNPCLKLTTGDVRFMVRLGGQSDEVRSLEREFSVLKMLDGSGLAPSPVMFDRDRKFIVYEYLPGEIWSPGMLREAGALEALADALARLHSYEQPGTVCDPVKTVGFYLRNADPVLRTQLMDIVRDAMGGLHGRQRVLCHHDLWCGNILQGSGTRFIDWEFANGGAALIDLATLVCYHGLGEEETEALWRSYASRMKKPPHREDLATWCTIVDCLTVAWSQFTIARGEASGVTGPFYGPAVKRLALNFEI